MAIRKILFCGEPVLRRKADKILTVNDEIRTLLDDMVETLIAAPGVGLAAPQVGVSLRCLVARDEDEEGNETIYKIINPRLRVREGVQIGPEGCLSLPTLQAEVKRPMRVKVTGLGADGESIEVWGEGLLARCLLHEMDHLDGVLFCDRAEPGSLGWVVPDDKEPNGHRFEECTLDEVEAAFNRMRERLAQQEAQQ